MKHKILQFSSVLSMCVHVFLCSVYSSFPVCVFIFDQSINPSVCMFHSSTSVFIQSNDHSKHVCNEYMVACLQYSISEGGGGRACSNIPICIMCVQVLNLFGIPCLASYKVQKDIDNDLSLLYFHLARMPNHAPVIKNGTLASTGCTNYCRNWGHFKQQTSAVDVSSTKQHLKKKTYVQF